MALFRRSTAGRNSPAHDRPFWQIPPLRTASTDALREYGVNCFLRDDGEGLLRTGWALWELGPLNENQTADFLSDGYRLWSSGASPIAAVEFLTAAFGRSLTLDASYPSDIYAVPQSVVQPALQIYRLRSWAGMALIAQTETLGDPAQIANVRQWVYDGLKTAHPAFLPGRAAEFMRDYAP